MEKEKEKEKNRKINDGIFIFLLPLIATILLEFIHRGNLVELVDWIVSYTGEFFANYLLCFGLINLFYIFYRKIYVALSFLIISIMAIGAFASKIKMEYRGEPLLPYDLKLGKEATNISAYLGDILNIKIIIFVSLFVLLVSALIYFLPKKKHDKTTSISVCVLSILLIVMMFTDKPYAINVKLGIETMPWDQGMHYDQNGFALGFFLDTKWMKIKQPNNYEENTVKTILEKVPEVITNDNNDKPNVIFVMSEAFWDPTLMKNVEFDKDPIPYFRSLQEDSVHGTMLAPVYGGGTANTEFEALTGFSTEFLPSGAIAYAQYGHKPLNSLANIYSEQGYKSTAIHTYHNWFYDRDNVYKNFGFDNFISAEFFNNPKIVRNYIADEEIVKRILKEVEHTEEPDFIYAITMQNHGPYPSEGNPENTIKVKGNLSQESKGILETYTQALSDADKSLEQLIEGIKNINEPTVVVFFGDHLPMLGQNYQVYKEAGYFEDGYSHEEYLKMYGVPYVIWDNFTENKEEYKITPNFFGQYVLEITNQKGTAFTNYLNQLFKKGLTFIPKKNHWEVENISEEDLKDYELLQYDQLFGKGYVYKNGVMPSATEDFYFGSVPQEVEAASPVEVSNEKEDYFVKTTITGKGFSSQTKVFMGEEQLETNFVNENTITAVIPEANRNKMQELEIEIKTLDSLNNNLTYNKKVTVDVLEREQVDKVFKENSEQIVLGNSHDWELFSTKNNLHIVRTKLFEGEKNYLLEQNGIKLDDENADTMEKINQSDIYPNGYLYISLDKNTLPESFAPVDIAKYIKENNYILYVTK